MCLTTEGHLNYLIKQTQLKTFCKEKQVVVSSVYTLDCGFETMVFPADEEGEIFKFKDYECVHYKSYEEMRIGHEKIVKKWSKRKWEQ